MLFKILVGICRCVTLLLYILLLQLHVHKYQVCLSIETFDTVDMDKKRLEGEIEA